MSDEKKKKEVLSDFITLDDDALNLLESLVARLRAEIGQEAVKTAFRNNRPTITKGTLLSVLHATKPITYFIDPED